MTDKKKAPQPLAEAALDTVRGGAGGVTVAMGDVNGDGATPKKLPGKRTPPTVT